MEKCPDVCDFKVFTTEPNKEIMKDTVFMTKGWWSRGEEFQDMHLVEIQELIDITLEELTEEDLMETSISEPEPDIRKKM